jgi:hypothetical protein
MEERICGFLKSQERQELSVATGGHQLMENEHDTIFV